ncbi:MAG: right-handed parallel beta-helix repeat-containing protein, partial [Candidatus Hydrogenedentes bacterium]|nr:right-handed parallel beta-helix repeat-containing protein [Candidatus Hydrogenedentota bacterium]
RILPGSAAKPISDPAVRERIVEPSARDSIREIDLKAVGITDYGKMRARGFRRPYIPAPLELFVNGEAMHLARWPNDGVVPIGEVLDPGSVPRDGDQSNRGGVFRYDYDRPEKWKAAHDIFLSGLFGYGYADDTIRVGSIDTDKRVIAMAQPHMYGIKTGRPFHAYYALNLLEEIDQPGEYYVDRESGKLYFYPPITPADAELAVSIMEEPLVAMEGASFIRFQGLTFEVARGMGVYIERGTGCQVAGCTLRNMGIVGVCIGKGIEPDTVYRHETTGKPVSRELGSWHEHLYANSTYDRDAGTNHGVVGCDLYNLGAGGVSLGGGNRKTLSPANNYVRNCHIHDFNRLDRSYKSAVNIDGVGNRIEHCLIHDCPNSAIYLNGNDHVIQYNEVYRACVDADDMGVFYMGRDPSLQGNVIRFNYFHDNGSTRGSTSVLYFDDDACGTPVDGNIIARTTGDAVWVNHGCDHVFVNNVFYGNRNSVPLAYDTRAYDWKTDELQHKRLLEDLDITQPPYSTRYPRLIETFNVAMGKGRGNDVSRNVSVQSGGFGEGTNALTDNLVLETDPGFVDAASNLALRADSIVFRKVPGFEPIPLVQIGLYVDDYRHKR